MEHDAIVKYIGEAFDHVEMIVADGNAFFFAAPPGAEAPPDNRLPFATLVTSDQYDQFSHLDRPGVFRLNLGVGPTSFRALIGTGDEAAVDYTALDTIMPHPVYGSMFWLCVLNPSAETFAVVQPLLAESYERAAARQKKLAGRTMEAGEEE